MGRDRPSGCKARQKKLEGKVSGWIVEEDGDGERVLFYKGTTTGFAPAYSMNVRNGRAIEKSFVAFGEGEALTLAQAAMIKARERGITAGVSGCAKTYNTVVIPDEEIGFLVYVLAATTEENAVVFGGHLRHDVDASGEAVVGFRKFTNSCLVVRRPKLPKDATIAALMVSQVVTNYPTEIHIWLALQHGVTLYVVAPEKLLWVVENGTIREVVREEKKQAATFDAPPAPASVAWPPPPLFTFGSIHAGAEQARYLPSAE